MGLDMFLYVRKKDTMKKIPKGALVDYGTIQEIDLDDDFIKKVGAERVLELIKSRNVFVKQEVKYNWFSLSTLKEVGYWRKANEIHKWFVENVQDGEDDCGYYIVNKEQLRELKDTCQKVLNSLDDNDMSIVKNEDGFEVEQYNNIRLAEELLPTQEGFFFGGTNYTKYYKQDLEDTIQICNECDYIADDFEILYHSSW